MSETTVGENQGKLFGELKCSYQSVFCKDVSVLSLKKKDFATNMLKQKKIGIHLVTCLRQQEGL